MPTIAIDDFDAALPDRPVAVRADTVELRLAAIAPLQTYRVVRGQGQAYADPAGLLRGEAGKAGRADDGTRVDDRRHSLPVPDHTALRDSLHGVGHRRR